MEVSLRDRRIILIFSCGAVAVILFTLTRIIEYENIELKENWNTLLFSVSIALIGICLFTLRRIGSYKEFIDSLELLIFLVIPTIALIPILSEPKINVIIFAPVYLGAVIGWLLLTKTYLVKPMSEGKEKKYTHGNVNIIWGMLMIYGAIFIGIFIFFIIPFFINPPPQ